MKLNKTNVIVALLVLVAIVFFFFNQQHHHHLSQLIQSKGWLGIAAAVFLMTLICLTPIPSEGLLFVIYNVYGVVMGSLYAWIGYTVSTLVVFVVTRYISTNFIREKIANSRFETVDRWVSKRSILGLLIVRILPIPAFIVNCILGTMPSVPFLKYLVSAVIAILPYYITSSFLYFGLANAHYTVLLVGAVLLFIMWWITFKIRKKNQEHS